ncbi:MAG: TetR/AcrR family transcriptional regulator [bacterium]
MVSKLRQARNTERREKTRQALILAAGTVFARKGYHATLISDIVAEIGVGQGTFYRSFENKRHIADALFDQVVESLFAEFSPMSSQAPTNVEAYRQASIDAVVRVALVIERNRELVLMFLREGPSIDGEFEQKLESVTDRFAGLARSLLELAIQGGFARPCDTEYVSQCIVGIGLRQIHLYLKNKLGDKSTSDIATEIVDFAFWGIGPRERSRSNS